MSRSGYTYEFDDPRELMCWRGAVRSALRGKRGQAFLREMLAALDALPSKRLVQGEIVESGECCAMGSVALARGLDVSDINVEYPDEVSEAFGIAQAMAQEIAYMNDEQGDTGETPEQRWVRMRAWVEGKIVKTDAPGSTKTIEPDATK